MTLKVKTFPALVYYNLGTLRKEKSRQNFDGDVDLDTFIEEVIFFILFLYKKINFLKLKFF